MCTDIIREKSWQRYTVAIEHLYGSLDSLIEDGTFENRKIYMFGFSKIAGMIIYYLNQKQVKLQGIIDNNEKSVGSTMLGLPVSFPKKLEESWDDSNLVLISSKYKKEMVHQLEEMGYKYGKHIIEVFDIQKEMEDYSFVDRTGYRHLTSAEIKQHQLSVLRCVKKVCEEQDLPYYIAYGTCLGAVRHRGFIPWDDDIDVYIPITSLNQFIEAVRAEEGFDIVSSMAGDDYYAVNSLMYDCNSVCDSHHFPLQLSTGMSIDIFPLFALPDDRQEIIQYSAELKNAEFDMMNKIYDRNECAKAAKYLFSLMQKYSMDTACYVGNLLGPYPFREILEKSWFAEGTMLEFENELFRAPVHYDAYLRTVYGDYMKLPPEEQRVGHHWYHVYALKESR